MAVSGLFLELHLIRLYYCDLSPFLNALRACSTLF